MHGVLPYQGTGFPDSEPSNFIILTIGHSPGHCLATVFPEFIARDDTQRAAPGPSGNPLRHRPIPPEPHTPEAP